MTRPTLHVVSDTPADRARAAQEESRRHADSAIMLALCQLEEAADYAAVVADIAGHRPGIAHELRIAAEEMGHRARTVRSLMERK